MHRSNDRGTYRIDRQFPGVGRINRSSGTTDKAVFRNLNEMLGTLYRAGRLDILAAIRDGKLKPLAAWKGYRLGRWDEIPTPQHLQPLLETFAAWRTKRTVSSAYDVDLGATYRLLGRIARAGATVADVPAVLEKYRGTCEREGIGAQFNRVRAHLQGFVKSTAGRSDPLWARVAGLERLPEPSKIGRHPQSVDEARTIAAALGEKAGPIWWSMCVTGMGPRELWGRWEIDRDAGAVRIYGTKRPGRSWNGKGRLVPLTDAPVVPRLSWWGFVSAMRRLEASVTPYDARRSFVNWLEQAGVSRTRRKLYLGHGAVDVTDLYERHEVKAFLADDAARLRGVLGHTKPNLEVMQA